MVAEKRKRRPKPPLPEKRHGALSVEPARHGQG
jgi:hypothetical protein